MQSAIDEYFDYCDNRIQQVYSKKSDGVIEIINPEPYTMSGLAYALGVDRDTILNYGKRDEFFGTVKRAREKVHRDVERRLMDGGQAAGPIFNLKNNFGWKDKTEQDLHIKELPKPILGGLSKDVPGNDSSSEASQTQEEN